MMTSIKCQDDRAGERGARPEWVWEYWQTDWVFRQESEVWGEHIHRITKTRLMGPHRMPITTNLSSIGK